MFVSMTTAKQYEVVVWNLHVIVTNDDGGWFAQGLEIDYAAQGTSLDEVKKNFEDGLAATIQAHLTLHDNLDQFLKPAPQEIWQELSNAVTNKKLKLQHISTHDVSTQLPPTFGAIEYSMVEGEGVLV